jgi:hypothetical protein
MDIRRVDRNLFNKWQSERHYLKRRIIQCKLLAHGVFVDGQIVGGLLWASPHFTKKQGLFGYPGLLDKWEVLMLGRFWLDDNCGLIASEVMANSIGTSGRGRRGSKRRGWRIQRDWVLEHPPKFPNKPFVPRLLISYSDTQWGHKGTIYAASGWQDWDITLSGGQHTGRSHWIDTQVFNRAQLGQYKQNGNGHKTTWILYLDQNPKAEALGQIQIQQSLWSDEAVR